MVPEPVIRVLADVGLDHADVAAGGLEDALVAIIAKDGLDLGTEEDSVAAIRFAHHERG